MACSCVGIVSRVGFKIVTTQDLQTHTINDMILGDIDSW